MVFWKKRKSSESQVDSISKAAFNADLENIVAKELNASVYEISVTAAMDWHDSYEETSEMGVTFGIQWSAAWRRIARELIANFHMQLDDLVLTSQIMVTMAKTLWIMEGINLRSDCGARNVIQKLCKPMWSERLGKECFDIKPAPGADVAKDRKERPEGRASFLANEQSWSDLIENAPAWELPLLEMDRFDYHSEVDMCGYEDPPPKNSTTKRMVMLYALVLSRLADIEFILKDDATKAKAAKILSEMVHCCGGPVFNNLKDYGGYTPRDDVKDVVNKLFKDLDWKSVPLPFEGPEANIPSAMGEARYDGPLHLRTRQFGASANDVDSFVYKEYLIKHANNLKEKHHENCMKLYAEGKITTDKVEQYLREKKVTDMIVAKQPKDENEFLLSQAQEIAQYFKEIEDMKAEDDFQEEDEYELLQAVEEAKARKWPPEKVYTHMCSDTALWAECPVPDAKELIPKEKLPILSNLPISLHDAVFDPRFIETYHSGSISGRIAISAEDWFKSEESEFVRFYFNNIGLVSELQRGLTLMLPFLLSFGEQNSEDVGLEKSALDITAELEAYEEHETAEDICQQMEDEHEEQANNFGVQIGGDEMDGMMGC